MIEYEAIMISDYGTDVIVSAWGNSLEDATERATEAIQGFPGWTVTLSGAIRTQEEI